MAGRRKLGSASLKTGRLIWPCLAGERGPDGRGKWPYADVILHLTYKEYADYGITYNEENEQLYYHNEPIKELTDQDTKVYYFSNVGKCYINIERDAKGKIESAIINKRKK